MHSPLTRSPGPTGTAKATPVLPTFAVYLADACRSQHTYMHRHSAAVAITAGSGHGLPRRSQSAKLGVVPWMVVNFTLTTNTRGAYLSHMDVLLSRDRGPTYLKKNPVTSLTQVIRHPNRPWGPWSQKHKVLRLYLYGYTAAATFPCRQALRSTGRNRGAGLLRSGLACRVLPAVPLRELAASHQPPRRTLTVVCNLQGTVTH
jgi:hypothetical protein